MSEELIERNKMEIANCRADREREDRCASPYVTMMALDETGCVTLYMAKRPREEDAHAEDPALFEVCRYLSINGPSSLSSAYCIC